MIRCCQVLQVLRGCLASFLAGYAAIICIELLDGAVPNASRMLVIYGAFGAVIALVLTVAVLAIWIPLAIYRVRVRWGFAPLVAALPFGALFYAFDGNLYLLVFGFVFGGCIGMVFWLVAFGWRGAQQMQFRAGQSRQANRD